MSSLPSLRPLSFAEYLELEHSAETKHEFVAGFLYAMAGASEAHNRISLNLAFHLRAAARGGPCGVFIADMKVRVEAYDSCYSPDVAVVCDPGDGDAYVKQAPCLIVEVLSDSTAATDRREKRVAYQALPSLRYLLLVSSNERRVDCFVRNDQGEWDAATLQPDERLRIECPAYAAELDLERIYEDVALPD
ncbi:MAG: Uma2 family endonuclease [Gammaproteobacteria bacterium]|nr:Uma2 family endonuclease [Gammaproteobacteria bacterium]